MVDDDREWVAQLPRWWRWSGGWGSTSAGVLLGAAVFTIGSVIRLTAYLYEEEITVMRLVGATEFYIRGPFYAEGLLQGLLGGAVAAVPWRPPSGRRRAAGGTLLGRMLVAAPPSLAQLAALVALGAAAGLAGAVLSLRRESPRRAAARRRLIGARPFIPDKEKPRWVCPTGVSLLPVPVNRAR